MPHFDWPHLDIFAGICIVSSSDFLVRICLRLVCCLWSLIIELFSNIGFILSSFSRIGDPEGKTIAPHVSNGPPLRLDHKENVWILGLYVDINGNNIFLVILVG